MSFNTNGSERLRINSEGCLGINTTNPLSGAKLDVSGKTRIYQNELQITSSAAYTHTLTTKMGVITISHKLMEEALSSGIMVEL